MTTLERYGWKGVEASGVGRVVSAHGDYYHLVCNEAEGEIIARKKTSAFRNEGATLPVTGDFVRFLHNPAGESRISATLPRMSAFFRLDPSGSGRRVQTLAANFDTVFFLMSLNENFSLARARRFRALAEASGCLDRAVLLLTKSDLLDGRPPPEADIGIPCQAISVKTGAGMEAVGKHASPGATLALLGSSGVGKSSLVNALAGEEWMATCEIQHWSGKGRHTTTSRELVMLPSGAMVIDTPGMRELGLLDEGPSERFSTSATHRYRTSGSDAVRTPGIQGFNHKT